MGQGVGALAELRELMPFPAIAIDAMTMEQILSRARWFEKFNVNCGQQMMRRLIETIEYLRDTRRIIELDRDAFEVKAARWADVEAVLVENETVTGYDVVAKDGAMLALRRVFAAALTYWNDTGAGGANDTGWLIEFGDAATPRYWDGASASSTCFDSEAAVRFARREDALRVLERGIASGPAGEVRVAEHAWTRKA
jgi:hypothetical protein